MGYLDLNNNVMSGNTFRLYLSDYGKSVLTSGDGLYNAIQKFGLSDNDIDYRKFVGSGSCSGQTGVSGFSDGCFTDIPDSRGLIPTTTEVMFGELSPVMAGPSVKIKDNRIKTYDTTLGFNPDVSTIWAKYTTPTKKGEIKEPLAGTFSGCWTVGDSVAQFYPSFCTACADLNGDGVVDIEDCKLLINFMGSTADPGEELMGDLNGDGVVDVKDLFLLYSCIGGLNYKPLEYCNDTEIFCMLCDRLGNESPCTGDCTKCI